MTRRYLFGPVSTTLAEQSLRELRQAGDCLAFDATGTLDLAIGPADSWESVCGRLPPGWQPDFVVLYLSYMNIPACLWSAPVPVIGLAADWNLCWHSYRRLGACDLVLTDSLGVEALGRAGISQVRAANLYGCDRDFLEAAWPEGPRPIDVLFVGNLHQAVQRERLPWLGRLARLAERWNVCIRAGVFGDGYRELLGQARIVFNRGIRGECNRRVFEAAAAGALLFQEADNREVPAFFRDRKECVYYTADTLVPLLEHYLEHEDKRRAIAEAARGRMPDYSFEKLWQGHLRLIEDEWAGVVERSGTRRLLHGTDDLLARTWQALGSVEGVEPSLVPDLAAALVREPSHASLHNALGMAVALTEKGQGPTTAPVAEKSVGYFRRALDSDPGHVVAGLNLVEALVGLGRKPEAIEQAQRTLAALEQQPALDPHVLDSGHFPPGFDHFRVEWERAGWAHAGQPAAEAEAKRDLLRWRLHILLGDLTGDLHHYYEAALARPDLPVSQAALGCALGRAGQAAQAATHLRAAVEASPFDLPAARALFQALGASGDGMGQRRLAHDRRLLHQAAPQAVPAEEWFQRVPPVGDELVSVLILCCDQLDYTRQCLDSVLCHTRAPYELILVDNGSSDGTLSYLEEVRDRCIARQPPVRVQLIRNETNRGFPAGCNQALACAQGQYVVLLNNDTVVTEGWLEGLIEWALYDWPNVGMVGAVTNYTAAPQQIPADYRQRDGLEGLESFARRRRQEFVGKALNVERLTGFCLLIRREVLDKVGVFDERYGLGFFDDDDLCVRAREAGFRLLVALGVFVHHYGSRTFAGLGIDCEKQLLGNFEQFRAKWGPERSAGYRLPRLPAAPPVSPAADGQAGAGPAQLPAPASAQPEAAPMPTVPATAKAPRPPASLCMIVRNEEKNLPTSLGSVADIFPNKIVADTGSTDRTREVAASYGARVVDFPWVDDFAAARNESMRHATGWNIFWLDGDDQVDRENHQKLAAVVAGLTQAKVALSMKCECLPDHQTKTSTVVDHIRLFPNHPKIRWRYRVHEQILPALREEDCVIRWSDVVIRHKGYQDAGLRARKLERDLRLLLLEDADKPNDAFTLFNLGCIHAQELRRPAEALPLLKRSLERSHPTDSIVRKLYALIASCQRHLSQRREALATCQEGRQHYPEDVELLFLEGVSRIDLKDPARAEACLLKCLASREKPHFASVDTGVQGYKARYHLAAIYLAQGRTAEAEAQWQAALAENPDFLPAWVRLGELALARGRWDEVDKAVLRLEAGGRPLAEATALRARGHMARREFPEARRVLEEAIGRTPGEVLLWGVLSQALLQEGRDWPAAERALRKVMELDPGNVEAQVNLAILLRQAQGVA